MKRGASIFRSDTNMANEAHMDEIEVKESCGSKCNRAMPHPRDIKKRFCEDFKGKVGPMAKGTFVFEYVQVRIESSEDGNWPALRARFDGRRD